MGVYVRYDHVHFVDVALSNTLKRFNYVLETVFQHAEKWEAPDIKESGKVSVMLIPQAVMINVCLHVCMCR